VLTSTLALNDYLDWPEVGQVFRVERTRMVGGVRTTEVVYGITSLTRERADAERLLDLVRAHWGIENRLHYVRDETLGEDRCRVRKGSAAEILAAVRNVAVYLLEGVGAASKAAATRRLAARPGEALRLVLT
jgi:hypothetical protein